MHEVALLRVSLLFGRAHADVTLSEGGAVATKSVVGMARAAASTMVMRSGRRFARFTAVEGSTMFFGAIRQDTGWLQVEPGQFSIDLIIEICSPQIHVATDCANQPATAFRPMVRP